MHIVNSLLCRNWQLLVVRVAFLRLPIVCFVQKNIDTEAFWGYNNKKQIGRNISMRVITVSRQFGSGGREIAKRLSDALGIAYYDKEILTAIAKESSLDEGYVERTLEASISAYPATISHSFAMLPYFSASAAQLHAVQYKIIRQLAEKGDCIIVGRAADCILADYNPFRIFVYADMESKIARCRSRASEDEDMSDKDIIKMIKKIDKSRAENHDLVSSTSWGEMASYDLCINTSHISIKAVTPILADYIKAHFEATE